MKIVHFTCMMALSTIIALGDEKPRLPDNEARDAPVEQGLPAAVPQLQSGLPDLALQPAQVIADPGQNHVKSPRGAQGVPAIERTTKGRLWAAWYSGKSKRGVESPSSYVVLATSGDDGATWTEKLVLQARKLCHTYDPCLWIDPAGKLWFFWTQSAGLQDGRMGVWAMTTTEADLENPNWSEPRRISNGVMLNKPTVLKNGTWLLPVGYWRDSTIRVIYDQTRYTENREGKKGVGAVLMAVFREEDLRAGKVLSENARLRMEVTRLTLP